MNIPDGRARHVIVRINFCDSRPGEAGPTSAQTKWTGQLPPRLTKLIPRRGIHYDHSNLYIIS